MNATQKSFIKSLPGNSHCADCSTSNPTWASISHGTVHCFDCIGKHRGLGVHISFARSMDLDSWDAKQMKYMGMDDDDENDDIDHNNDDDDDVDHKNDNQQYSGNDQFIKFMTQNTNNEIQLGKGREYIRQVYDNPWAQLYRAKLKAKVEGRPEPTADNDNVYSETKQQYDLHQQQQQQQQQQQNQQQPIKSTLTSHLMKSTLPSHMQRFIGGFKYYGFHYIIAPFKTNFKLSLSAFIVYITSKVTLHRTSLPNYIFQKLILSTLSSIIILSLYSIAWIKNHRQEPFKSALNLFQSRLQNGRIKRNTNYDMYFPLHSSSSAIIGSTIDKAFLFFPESLVDITSYAHIMSKLADSGILVILVNFNPTRIVTPTHVGGRLNDSFQIIYHVEKLMGINVKEWVLGGHGDGATVALEMRRRISFHRMKVMSRKSKELKCLLWGLSSPSTLYRFSKTLNANNTLFVICSNDLIAGKLRFKETIQDVFGSKRVGGVVSSPCCFEIIGGNHSAFSHYGPQSFPCKDGQCVKTIDSQQNDCFIRTLDFMLEREPVVKKKND